MRSKARGEGEGGGAGGGAALEAALDQLYAAPLDAFIALRKKLVTELRTGGDRAGAQAVGAVAKPSRTTWALNQVARTKPDLVQGALDARAAAAGAPKGGDAEQMRARAKAFRDRVNDVVQAAGAVLRDAGADLTAAQGRTIGETLQAIASGEDEGARTALLAGRLADDVEVDDPFAGIDVGELKPREASTRAASHEKAPATHAAHAKPVDEKAVHEKAPAHRPPLHVVPKVPAAGASGEAHRAREAKAREAQARQREEAARQAREEAAREARQRAVEAARAKVTALEDRAKEARAAARVAEVAAHRAQADAERLRRAATDLDKELAEAKAALRSHTG